MNRWALIAAILISFALTDTSAQAMVFPQEAWEVGSPESQGIDGDILGQAMAYLAANAGGAGAAETLVIRNGYLIWQGTNVDAYHSISSGTKTFTTALLGVLIQEGRIASLDAKAVDYYPQLDDTQNAYADISFRHLANFTSGYTADTSAVGDMVWGDPRVFLTPLPPRDPVGTTFRYYDPAIHLLGHILTQVSGENLESMFQSRIADQIGMARWEWQHHGYSEAGAGSEIVANFLNPSGIYSGGIHTTASDLARYGLLHLNRGNWDGNQLLNSDWVDQATTNQVALNSAVRGFDRRGQFGFMWWTNGIGPDGTRQWPSAPPNTYTLLGNSRNYCFIVPEWDMVIVRMSPPNLEGMPSTGEAVWDAFFSILASGVRVNTPPAASDDSYGLIQDSTLRIAAPGVLSNDSDADGDGLTAILVSDVAHGTLSLRADGGFDYVPEAGFSGGDSFTYRAADASAESGAATVSIAVNTDVPTSLILDNGGAGTAGAGLWKVSGGADPYGSDSVFSRQSGDSYTYTADLVPGEYAVYAWWTEWSNRHTGVPYEVQHADGTTTVNVNQQVNGGRWNLLGTWRFDAAATVTIRSQGGDSACADALMLEPVATNVAPVLAAIGDRSVTAGETLSFSVSASDTNGVPLLTAAGLPAGAVFTDHSDGSASFSWDTASGDVGDHSVSFTATDADDGSLSDSETVTLSVSAATGGNTAPTATDDSYATEADTPLSIAAPGVLGNDSDADGDGLTAVLVSDVAHGTLSLRADGGFDYTPDEGFSGSDGFTYTASDSTEESAAATVAITISPSTDGNTAPLATDDTYVTEADTPLSIAAPGVLGNDSDADGDGLTAVLVSDVAHGTLSLRADGGFDYEPDGGFSGSDGFTYMASDASDVSVVANVSIDVFAETATSLILDNGDAGTAGAGLWKVSGGADPYGSDSVFSRQSGDSFTYTADMVPGEYAIYAWWTEWSNRHTGVPYEVQHADGTTTVNVNQQVNGGRWNLLGTWRFDTAATVTIRSQGGDSTCADALMLEPVATNVAPVLAAIGDRSVTVGETLSFSVSASDTNGVPLLTAAGLPAGAVFTDHSDGSASFSWDTASGDVGDHSVSFTATDADDGSLSDSETVTLTVDPSSAILFSDSFSDGSGWRSRWNIINQTGDADSWIVADGQLQQQNYLYAFDASYQLGTYAVLSDPAVDNLPAYRLSLDITPLTNGVSGQREGNDVGIMFLYTDADNYYRVSLNARYGYTRFERRFNGEFETLAVNSIGYIDDQPMSMSVEVGADAIIVRIDGEAVFAEATPSIPSTHTPVALYCQDRVSFDNVSVEPATLAPMISIISPLAYSIALTPDDGDTLLVEAVVLNQPVGGDVVITLNGERETMATGSGSHFVAQFDGVATGDHDLAAVLRDAAGNTLDMDLNTTVGVGGDYCLTMGDSIANGVGDLFSGNNDSTDGRIVAIQGFQASLADALTTTTGRPQIVFNEGISGDRVSDLNMRVDSILERHPSANKVLLMIGTNGSSGNTDDPDVFQTEVEAIVDKVDILAGMQLWLAKTLPTYLITDPATLDQARNLIIGQFNAKIAAIADANLEDNTFLGPDFFDAFTTLADPLFYYSDYLHPSDNGYQVMADEWHDVLTP